VRQLALCIKEDDFDSHTTTLQWFGHTHSTKTYPETSGADCGVDGVDPVGALLVGNAVDQNGNLLAPRPGSPPAETKVAAVPPQQQAKVPTAPFDSQKWSGWIFSSDTPRANFRTWLVLTSDKNSRGHVSGAWHEEAINNPAISIAYAVSGTVTDDLIRLTVDNVTQQTPGTKWCSSFEDLAFSRIKTGDLKAIVNESEGIIHSLAHLNFARNCGQQVIDLFDLSGPTGPTAANAYAESRAAFERHDVNAAMRFLETAGIQGRAAAFNELGSVYDGESIAGPRHDLAVAAYRKAAAMGYRPAKHLLACLQPKVIEAMIADWKLMFDLAAVAELVGITGGDILKFTYEPFVYRLEVSDNEFSDQEFSCKPFFKVKAEPIEGVADKLHPMRTPAEQVIIGMGMFPQIFTFDLISPDHYRIGRQVYPTGAITPGHYTPPPTAFVAEVFGLFDGAGLHD
jgi:hypothetical protein